MISFFVTFEDAKMKISDDWTEKGQYSDIISSINNACQLCLYPSSGNMIRFKCNHSFHARCASMLFHFVLYTQRRPIIDLYCPACYKYVKDFKEYIPNLKYTEMMEFIKQSGSTYNSSELPKLHCKHSVEDIYCSSEFKDDYYKFITSTCIIRFKLHKV